MSTSANEWSSAASVPNDEAKEKEFRAGLASLAPELRLTTFKYGFTDELINSTQLAKLETPLPALPTLRCRSELQLF